MSECESCAERGRRGYCAPGRCYCAHPDCHAADSYVPLPPIPTAENVTKTPRSTSWDTREESTWIDQL